jgi:DNA polymerase I-like protein with 3'-5' exonuclease and polymerase domains
MADVKKVVKYCKMTGYCAHDYETSGHHSSDHRGYPTCISIAFQPGYAYVIPLAHKDSPLRKGNKWKRVLKYIGRELIQNDRIVKVAHNFKFEHGWWLKYGIRPRGVILDTMLMKYLLNEKRPHDLKSLAYSFFPQYANYSIKGEDTERTPEEVVQFWSNVPLETLAPYNALDSDLCLRLSIYLEQRIRECGFYQLYRNLLEMASYNLAEVESRGYLVDRPYLDGLCESYKIKIEEAEAKMYAVPSLVKYNKKRVKAAKKALLDGLLEQIEIKTNELDNTTDKKKLGSLQRSITNLQKKYDNYSAGVGLTKKDKESLQPLNLKSVKQLIDFLYYNKYGLRLPIIKYTEDKKTKKPTKNPATSEDVLLELKDKDETGFIETLLKYREITKLYSTYIVGIRDILNPDNTLHGSFLIHGTVTGRLSSRNPNLQNMPRDTTAKDIKYMFVCPKGKVMMQLDYSQAELRVVAGWSQDKQMLEWFRVGHDIHLATACKKYKISYEDAYKIYSNEDDPNYKTWKVRRKQAKCYSGDTEILTPTGWQRLDSYDGKSLVAQYNFDTEEISWVKPSAYGKVISKNNYTYKSRTVSLDVTSTHKTLFVTRHQKKIRTDFKNLVNKSGYMPVAGKVNFEFEDENLTRFLAMFTADGNIKNQWEKIRFGFSKEHKANRCRELLALCNIDYTEAIRNGKHYFCIIKKTNQPLYQWLSNWVSMGKELSWECLSHISGKIYLEEAQYWDSNISNKTGYVSFSTVVKQTAQVMQAMGHMNGIMVSFSETKVGDRTRYHLGYNLRRDTHLTRVDLNNSILTKTEGGRDMWGVTVDDHNLLVRKDNKIVLSGNTIGFGVLYQQGPNHLKESLSTPDHKATKEEAIEFLDEWFDTFPRIRKFVKKQQKFAEEHGYVVSPFGRKRRLPEARNKREQGKYAKALRDAVNAPIQGTASDFALFSSILIREQIMQGKLPASIEQIGTIHDSIMFYLDPKDMNDEVVDHLFNICKDPDTQKYFGFKLKGITMAVDFELGLRWSKLKGYKRGTDYAEVYKDCYIDHWWENKEIVALQEAS